MTATAIVETTLGRFALEVREAEAPKTAGNFLGYAEKGDYDGIRIHRVAAGFVIQMGDLRPKGITAAEIPWEPTGLKNLRGAVAMARRGDPNDERSSGTGTSQFFISLRDNPRLDGYRYPYVVFAQVAEGWDALEKIAALPTRPPGDGEPETPVTVASVRIRR